jgi:membrane-associated protein
LIESSIASLVELHPLWIALVIAGIAFLEACPGVGLFVSGILLLTVSTAVYANGLLLPTQIMAAAFTGAILADHTGYFLGRWLGPRLENSVLFRKRRAQVAKAEALISQFGVLAVLAGRLVPAVRSVIPTLVGVSSLRLVVFTVADVVACSIWVLGLTALNQGLNTVLN